MDVGRFDEFEDGPVCRFGPGGDYVRDWLGGANRKREGKSANPLRKVLEMLADIIGATVDPAMFGDMRIEGPSESITPVTINDVMEGTSEGSGNDGDSDHAAAVGDIEDHSAVRGQSLLFGDDGGTGRSGRRKSHHRVRAYRKPPKKRSSCQIEGQGTLFEIDSAGQSAA